MDGRNEEEISEVEILGILKLLNDENLLNVFLAAKNLKYTEKNNN
jgi:hypothetical protein